MTKTIKGFYFLWPALTLLIMMGCATTGKHDYTQRIYEIKSVPGLSVTVSYLGGYLWNAKVKNNSPLTAKLVWDDSAYVNSAGKSTRIIRGQTKKLYTGRVQPNSPIPPNALLNEQFTGEAFVRYVNPYAPTKVENPDGVAHIFLSFEVDGKAYTWEGAATFLQKETVKPKVNN